MVNCQASFWHDFICYRSFVGTCHIKGRDWPEFCQFLNSSWKYWISFVIVVLREHVISSAITSIQVIGYINLFWSNARFHVFYNLHISIKQNVAAQRMGSKVDFKVKVTCLGLKYRFKVPDWVTTQMSKLNGTAPS